MSKKTSDRRQFSATVHYTGAWHTLPANAVVQPFTVAEYAGCSMKTITRHVQAGKLKGFTVGEVNRWLTKAGELKRGRPRKLSRSSGHLFAISEPEKVVKRARTMRNFRV